MAINDNLRKLKCKKCGTRFRYPKRLEKHEEIAHNKKKERCRSCGKEFHFLEKLRLHKKVCKGKL